MNETILTIDLGTSRCKTTLFALDGRELARETRAYPTRFPREGYAEQNPEDWWQRLTETVHAIANSEPALDSSLQGIVVTGQMHGLVCVDQEGERIHPFLTLHDQRSLRETDRLRNLLGDEAFYDITGERLSPSLPIAKLVWLKKNAPDAFRSARWFLGCKDYVRSRLTGNFCTDAIDAAATGLMDIQDENWSQALCDTCELPLDALPPIRASTQVDGPLTVQAASQLGLSPGIPVVVGAGDDVEIIGAGLAEPGTVLEHIGTTGSLLMCVDSRSMGWESGLELYPHPLPNRWVLGGSTSSAGAALKWATEVLGIASPMELTGKEVSATDNPELTFIPYLAGERCPVWAPKARGAVMGLALHHSRADFIRSIYEGVACSLRHLLDALGDLGVKPKTIRIPDDGAPKSEWNQVRANLYEIPLSELTYSDPTAHGAMVLAAVALGLDNCLRDAMQRIARVQATVTPTDSELDHYRRLYERYKQISNIVLSIA